MTKKADTNPVAAAVEDYKDLPSKDVPAGVKKLAKLATKDLKAEFYKVERVTYGGDLYIRLKGGRNLFIEAAKDPHETDPHSPAFMTDEEREVSPTGIRYSAHLDKATVAILLEDPEQARHFTFVPID